MPTTIERPRSDEHAEFYGAYVALVPDGDLVELLREQQQETVRLVRDLSDADAMRAYAPGKWTVKEVIGHLSDAERIFAYRALRFARGDARELAGFDETAYVPAGRFNTRRIADLLDEFQAIRTATVHLLRHLRPEELARRGTANGYAITVRAIAYVIAGHERHHAAILRERYGL
ncbi:MAG TPA: DinB family protein [Gemmatimonadaceae bacterium]|nr:DinB family protein [Gemmatimonadaceae bacterium]